MEHSASRRREKPREGGLLAGLFSSVASGSFRPDALHRKLVRRLFSCWCILSLAICGIVFAIEMERIDDLVLRLALQESRSFSSDSIEYINSPNPAYQKLLLEVVRAHMANGHFVVVELYNRDKAEILKLMGAGGPEAEAAMSHDHTEILHLTDVPDYRKHYQGGTLYLRAYAPIRSGEGQVLGYFEGIYRVDAETLRSIRDRLVMSLLLVIAVISFTTVVLYPVIISLNRGLLRYSRELSQANVGMLKMLGAAVAKRDSDTSSHSCRVSIYAIRLAEALALGRNDIQGIIKGGLLHDVGKIAISDSILLKPARLTDDEYAVMQTHVSHGVELIERYAWLGDAVDVVRHHHERYDGGGYSHGLKGEEIPLAARIFCIADYFDALTSTRPYREELPFDSAVSVMADGSGIFFDPELVAVFLRTVKPVYDEIVHADEQDLERKLDTLIEKYLDAEPAEGDAVGVAS
jgi:putative nucleotidyltransferase with HDIG domain